MMLETHLDIYILQSHFSALEELVLENQYGSCIVSNIVRQLLFNCFNLQSLTLQLGKDQMYKLLSVLFHF